MEGCFHWRNGPGGGGGAGGGGGGAGSGAAGGTSPGVQGPPYPEKDI